MNERGDEALSKAFPTSDEPHPTSALHPTKNDLLEPVREKMIELLNARLADAVDLHSQCKQAHWNVRGPSFFSLHGLFDQIADDAQDWADALAERAAQLGGFARGTARMAAERSMLPDYPERAVTGADHVDAVSDALATFARMIRAAIGVSVDDDDDTADVFTEISRGADKWLWMVEVHAQER